MYIMYYICKVINKILFKVRKATKTRNRYNYVPQLTQGLFIVYCKKSKNGQELPQSETNPWHCEEETLAHRRRRIYT